MNARRLGPVTGLRCFGLVLLVATGGYSGSCSAFNPEAERVRESAHLGAPRVVTGAGRLSRSQFLAAPDLGVVTDIKFGKVDPDPGIAAAVAGQDGAVYLHRDGAVASTVPFAKFYPHVDVVDVEGDGSCEFLNRATWSDPVLLAHDGHVLWTYRVLVGADDAAPGDIDRDGKLEFAVGCNDAGGVRLLGPDGRLRWRQPDLNVWHVELAELDATGVLNILHSNAEGELIVRDGRGAVLRTTDLPSVYLSDFVVVSWPSPPPAVIAPGDGIIGVYDASGTSRLTLQAPDADHLADIQATSVTLRAGSPAYLAVALAHVPAGRSLLYLYDSKGSLAYQEVLPDLCEALAPLPLGNSGAQALLVGGHGTVTKYTWAGSVPK